MGDYQQGRADLKGGSEHAAFSGAHDVSQSESNIQGQQDNNGTMGHSAQNRHEQANGVASHSASLSQSTHAEENTAGHNLRGNRVPGEDMQNDFRANQNRLQEQRPESQNDIQRKVAEQRSANEQNINKSSGEIDKKQSTVQKASGMLKDENHNARSSFDLGFKEEQYSQSNVLNPFDGLDGKKLQNDIENMKKQSSGGK